MPSGAGRRALARPLRLRHAAGVPVMCGHGRRWPRLRTTPER